MGVEAKLFQLDNPEISDKLLFKKPKDPNSEADVLLNYSLYIVLHVYVPWIQMPVQIKKKKKKIPSGT